MATSRPQSPRAGQAGRRASTTAPSTTLPTASRPRVSAPGETSWPTLRMATNAEANSSTVSAIAATGSSGAPAGAVAGAGAVARAVGSGVVRAGGRDVVTPRRYGRLGGVVAGASATSP